MAYGLKACSCHPLTKLLGGLLKATNKSRGTITHPLYMTARWPPWYFPPLNFLFSEYSDVYRLITAYLLLRVNLDKIMHARWDFDASSAQTRRVSALDKHQNRSASALFCLNSREQSKYAVVNLIHANVNKLFCLLYVINKTF